MAVERDLEWFPVVSRPNEPEHLGGCSMDQVKMQPVTDALGTLEAVRAFIHEHRKELREGNLEALRPHAARLEPFYRDLLARLERVRERTGMDAELDFSPWLTALAPLFAPRQKGWIEFLRAAAL